MESNAIGAPGPIPERVVDRREIEMIIDPAAQVAESPKPNRRDFFATNPWLKTTP
jgi:hypothetical protein